MLVRKPEGNKPFRKLGTDGRLLLRYMLIKNGVKMRTEFVWLRMDPVACCCEQCNVM
jgi:hypothetical protein